MSYAQEQHSPNVGATTGTSASATQSGNNAAGANVAAQQATNTQYAAMPYYTQPGMPPQGYQFSGAFPAYAIQPGMAQGMYTYPIPQMQVVPINQIGAMGTKTVKRRQVKNACTNCQKACKKCDETRPCTRCMKYGLGETCIDSLRKERKKGVKRGPYKRRKDRDLSPGDKRNRKQSIDRATTPDASAAAVQANAAYGHPYSNIGAYGNVSFDPNYSAWRYDQNAQFQGYTTIPYPGSTPSASAPTSSNAGVTAGVTGHSTSYPYGMFASTASAQNASPTHTNGHSAANATMSTPDGEASFEGQSPPPPNDAELEGGSA